MVHLDLKSSNVLIAADGSAKISDVGLAALMSQNYLSQMAPAGTWSWVAPEVILGGVDLLLAYFGYTTPVFRSAIGCLPGCELIL